MSRTESVRVLAASRLITVVSGLPRSGTSMMMQMLEAAGLPLAIDGHRIADSDNSRGYYELDAVKRLRDDASFLKSVVGQGIKVVTPLLPFLPPEYDYRVIWMERNLNEILASQRVMLGRSEFDASPQADDRALARAYHNEIDRVKRWLDERSNIRTCFVLHRRALCSPAEISATVLEFLTETGGFGAMADGGDRREMIQARMTGIVDPRLYRQQEASES